MQSPLWRWLSRPKDPVARAEELRRSIEEWREWANEHPRKLDRALAKMRKLNQDLDELERELAELKGRT